MQASVSLGDFLKSRRASVDPAAAGVSSINRRRVAGLRREEVAMIAGVSVAYYTRLEQGKAQNASNEVLLALARAMRMTSTETEHLMDLAHTTGEYAQSLASEEPSAGGLAMIDAVWDKPAILLGRYSDVLAWTPLGHALIAPDLAFNAVQNAATRPNLPRLLFLDAQVRESYQDWEHEADSFVAYLRLMSGKYPGDPRLERLVGELCMKDDSFARLWAAGRVGECTTGTKHLTHERVGQLSVDFHLWHNAEQSEQRLEIYSPHNEAAKESLTLLASLTATEHLHMH
ncbi:helix-turn-helix domain-containing protein [Leucobacter japonicus]|uniref:helix-turn-helix domain-containing protein n=1 Tax=Leucobacter japonicus TaxID=1461259 RepID=UPI0006A788EE|nr:helix-turn-helix transcriptional regulator [Leucobacter japonicus]